MSIFIRRNICVSWLDPEGGKRLAGALKKRLDNKFALDENKTKRSRFVTLTYDRTPYGDEGQFDLWREAQRADGHIKLFIRRLERRYGKKLTGKWIAKKEFQDGGWLHWHLIFYDTGNISIEDIRDAWGHGHCHIEAIDHKASQYISKYQAKPGEVPGWLYDLPGRSLKLVQCSPGFWDHEKKADRVSRPRVNYFPREYNKAQPIWQRIEIANQTISVKQEWDRPRRLYGDLGALQIALQVQGIEYLGQQKTEDGKNTGNFEYDATFEEVKDVMIQHASHDTSGNAYRKTFINHNNYANTPGQAGGFAAAARRLLDTYNKNKDAQTVIHEDTDYDGPAIIEDRFETQAEYYGWAQLACVDRQYVFKQSQVHDTIIDPDHTLQGDFLPF